MEKNGEKVTITEITDPKTWEHLFTQFGSPSFLQSWEWGEVQRRLGYEVLPIALKHAHSTDPLALALCIGIHARRGRFLFIPHGPLIHPEYDTLQKKEQTIQTLTKYLLNYAKKQGYLALRIAPSWHASDELSQMFQKLHYRTAPIYMHAERMWVLPLESKSENELLSGMRKTTRYLIRRSEKDGVMVVRKNNKEGFDEFMKLYDHTAKRERFVPFSKDYIKAEFEEFAKNGNAELFLAYHNKKPLAGALILYTASSAFYHQGASIHTKIPAPYALQWTMIQRAKQRGCRYYNFWGILQKNRTPKNWGGLTLFKKGFGGEQWDYCFTKDYPIKYKYVKLLFIEFIIQMVRILKN